MMKKISVLLAFMALFFADFALAQGAAVVASLTGTANVQTGAATPRALRMGDQVLQGDTVSTGANSSLVLKFDDGEVTALTQNSRMTITAYQYEPAGRTGNMLLSLVRGGMRAVTGLLGRNQPDHVAYRAATATIGIRGTDVSIATDGNDVVVTVTDGSITLTLGNQTITLNAGESVTIHGTTMTRGAASQGPLPVVLHDLDAAATAINNALAGTPAGLATGAGTGTANSVTVTPGGGGGGSPVSPH